MSCECPNQQQMCDPVRGLPYNPSGIPFIDEEQEESEGTPQHLLHAVVVCGNDLRHARSRHLAPEAQGLIPGGHLTPTRHTGEKPGSRRSRSRHSSGRGPGGVIKANDVRIHAAERVGQHTGSGGHGGSGGGGGSGRRGSLRRSLRGLANKVTGRKQRGGGHCHHSGATELSSDGRGHSAKACDCRATLLSLLLSGSYVLLAVIAAVVTYSLVSHLVEALRYPVRAVRYRQVDSHTAPAIVLSLGGAVLAACSSYNQHAVPSMVRLGQLDLFNQNCTYVNISSSHYSNNNNNYNNPSDNTEHTDGLTASSSSSLTAPHWASSSSQLVIRGPAQPHHTLFLHLVVKDSVLTPPRDFYSVSYFVFPGWDHFNSSSEENRTSELQRLSKIHPISTLGAGFKFWVRLSSRETHFPNSDKNIKLKTEHSAIKYYDRRPFHERNRTHLFFLFFEWKDNLVEETYVLYTATAWHVAACLCAVFLTLHKAYTFLRASVKKAKRNRRKRKYSSLNSKTAKAEAADEHSCECACAEAADKNQSCDNES